MLFSALAATILIETAIYCLVIRKDYPRLVLYGVVINTFTLPPATWIYQHVVPDLFLVEAGVVLVETVLIAALLRLPPTRAFLLSLLANGITALIGILVPMP